MLKWAVGGAGLAAAGYAAWIANAWWRYGHPSPPARDEADPLLDRFMPRYDVVERHQTYIEAPADVVLEAAKTADLWGSALVQAIFKARELVLGAEPAPQASDRPRGVVAQTTALGWVVLAETPGREIVLGAVTQPWLANVVFRGVAPESFLVFDEPDYVKIVWNLRADPVGSSGAIFRTETRVTTTSREARAKFRWYWARFSPGIILIRRMMLGPIRREAREHAGRAA
jgi:hypothetical protein